MTTMQQSEQSHRPKILFVDDERAILKSLERFARSQNWDVTVKGSGAEAIASAEDTDFDLIVSDMRMPEMSGAELLQTFEKQHPRTVRILLTGFSDMDTLGSAINDSHVYNYLTKPWDETHLVSVIDEALQFRRVEKERDEAEAQTKTKNIKLSKLALLLDKQVKERSMEVSQALNLLQISHDKSREALFESVSVINRILEWKEGRAHGQSEFVTHYAVKMAKQLQFSDTDVESVHLAALMHRVGLLALPDEIRKKPIYALSKEELNTYKQYPLWGERSISHASQLKSIAKIVRHHREYINGNGYPDGLCDKEIPVAAQIVGLVSDFYDAYSGQIDKNIQGVEAAKTYIKEWAGRRHDVNLVDIFWQVLEDFCDTSLQTCVLSTNDLKPGMILSENIHSKNNSLLLAKDTVINEAQINKLIEYEQSYREVFEITIRIPETLNLGVE
ncbi:HD domain-containing phosphohydrolase [Agaribacterium sp. ZY112]|uniref:HD domain-containing phosphohydrolase n=1 Tax=Agaribacterium sp. ZY112 TaxID=3233574 RepID=UPI003524340B